MDSKIYEVESILGKKEGRRGPLYYINWKGFDESHNSWEPEKNLIHCEQLIEDFNARHQRPTTRSTRSMEFSSDEEPAPKKKTAPKSPARRQKARSPARKPKKSQGKKGGKGEKMESAPVVDIIYTSIGVTESEDLLVTAPVRLETEPARKEKDYTSSFAAISSDDETDSRDVSGAKHREELSRNSNTRDEASTMSAPVMSLARNEPLVVEERVSALVYIVEPLTESVQPDTVVISPEQPTMTRVPLSQGKPATTKVPVSHKKTAAAKVPVSHKKTAAAKVPVSQETTATTRLSLSHYNLRRRLADITPAYKSSLRPTSSGLEVSPTYKSSVKTRLAFESLRTRKQEETEFDESDYPAAAEEKIAPLSLTTSVAAAPEPTQVERRAMQDEIPAWMHIGYAELVFAFIVTIIFAVCLLGYWLGYF